MKMEAALASNSTELSNPNAEVSENIKKKKLVFLFLVVFFFFGGELITVDVI